MTTLIELRDIIAYPPGNNASDTIISGIHFNTSALDYYNYTYYSNGTLSNKSHCYLMFAPYTPAEMLPNGSFINTTSCYSPIDSIGPRAGTGIGMAVAFGLSLLVTLMNLRKHGRRYLPAQKRFAPVGRRWQWYWMSIVAGCAMISGFVGVDVDRYYLPELPLVLQNFFWYLMLPSTMACVWEGVRHWGSWQERQMIDPDPFMLPQDDRRGKTEFWLPLVFYFFTFMNFFLVVPRAWGRIEQQRSPQQTAAVAKPAATDGRFKGAAFCLFFAWTIIIFSLRHSIFHYKPRNRGLHNRALGFVRYTPFKFMLTIPLALVMVGYEAACAWDFGISSMNLQASPSWIYGLGWAPILLITIIYEIYGFIEPNEDLELLRQRRVRGAEIDREMGDLGYTKKPAWWHRIKYGGGPTNVHDQIAANVREVGGGTATTRNLERAIEMGNMPVSQRNEARPPGSQMTQDSHRRQTSTGSVSTQSARPPSSRSNRDVMTAAADLLFPVPSYSTIPPTVVLPEDSGGRGRDERPATSERSTSTATDNSLSALNPPPQKIRSMLDI